MASRHRVCNPDLSPEARATLARASRVPARPAAARRAFTLIELSTVVLVVGILAVIAIPRFADSNSQYRAETAAKRVQADMHLARDLARSLSLAHNTIFKPGSTSYIVEPASAVTTPLEIANTGARVTNLAVHPFNSRIMKASFGGISTLTFNAFGSPVNAGHVVLYANDWGAIVRVAKESGQVDINLFRVSNVPVSVLAEVGAMDAITRTTSPNPTKPLFVPTAGARAGVAVEAVDVLTPGSGGQAAVDTSTRIGP